LGGNQPSGSDAFIFSLFCGILNDFFDDPYRQYFANKENLVDYTNRMMALYYPNHKTKFKAIQ